MLRADLHIHSNISDGSDSIDEIVKKAIENNLDVIAITDHDTLSHKKYIRSYSSLKVIAGIEISAIDRGKKTKAHILGYNIKDEKQIKEFVHPTLEKRHNNSVKQIEILNKNGYKIDLDKLKRADGKYIYKQHIMEYLVKTKQVEDKFGEFYQKIFKNGGICDFDIDYVDVFEAVKTIKNAGGKAVLAHSGQQQNFYLIDKLVSVGLEGLEYNHPKNSSEDREIIKDYAKKHKLFLTGGSDYHGLNDKHQVKIGEYQSEMSGIVEIC